MMSAVFAASAWNAVVVRPLRLRENEVHEIRLPNGDRAALRLHRLGYQSERSIASELWWTSALASDGQPVPRPIPSASGDLLYRLEDGRLVSVVSWVDGDPLGEAGVLLAGTRQDQAQRHFDLGRLIAEIHVATDGLDLPTWFERHSWDLEGLVGETPLWGRFWEHPNLDPAQSEVLRQAREVLKNGLLESQSPKGLIHADVLRENVHVNGQSLSLLDFDDSGYGYRWLDLGTVLSQNLSEPGYEDIRAALVEGYGDPTGKVRDEVDLFTLARCCASVGWAAGRLPLDHPVQVTHVQRAVRLAKSITG